MSAENEHCDYQVFAHFWLILSPNPPNGVGHHPFFQNSTIVTALSEHDVMSSGAASPSLGRSKWSNGIVLKIATPCLQKTFLERTQKVFERDLAELEKAWC